MTPELAAFSDWTLALLPRLFLYPGGLSLLIALLLLRLASRGRKSISVRVLRSDLLHANLLSIALAWAAVALAPFPSTVPLPTPVDTFALAALPALSLLLNTRAPTGSYIMAAGAITLALILPAVGSNSLLLPPGSAAILSIVTSLAVISGLLALSWLGDTGLAGQVRWLAWLCLGVAPAWQRLAGGSSWGVILLLLLLVIILNAAARLPSLISPAGEGGVETRDTNHTLLRNDVSRFAFRAAAWAAIIAWLLALLALVWALPAAS